MLIKLIYARDYYNEGDYENGDKFIKEVEKSFLITPKVEFFINLIKETRNNNQNIKKRIK